MGLFGRKKETESKTFDKTRKVPAIRASICTGEQTAGFRDIQTGKFEEIMLIRGDADLEDFKRMYSIDEDVKKFY